MIPKKLAPAKAGVADFSEKIMRKIKENRERCRFNLIEKRAKGALRVRRLSCYRTEPSRRPFLESRR
jgi:hypothetical protein